MLRHLLIWSSCLWISVAQELWSGENSGNVPPKSGNFCADDGCACDGITCCQAPLYEQDPTCLGVTAFGDFLYWKATTNDLPMAVTGLLTIVPGITTFINDNSVQTVGFSYDPGFRIGLGYQFDRGWEFDTIWTRFHSDAQRTLHATPELGALDLIQGVWVFIPGRIIELKGHQFVHFDEVDFIFSKRLQIGTHFNFSPYFGPVYARIHQKLRLDQQMIFDVGSATQSVNVINNYSGGGIKVGFNAEFAPWNWLSAYGDGNYSLVYGGFKLQRKDLALATINGTSYSLPNNESSHEKGVTSAFNLDVGLKGSWSFCDDQCELIARIGYELLIWLDQIRVKRILTGDSVQSYLLLGNGDLGMQGLTAGLELRF